MYIIFTYWTRLNAKYIIHILVLASLMGDIECILLTTVQKLQFMFQQAHMPKAESLNIHLVNYKFS